MIAADGRVVWLRTSVHLVACHEKAQELAGVMLDITDRKLAEEAAEEASRTKSPDCWRKSTGSPRATKGIYRLGRQGQQSR